jgi:hypothetical protein
MIDLLLLLCLAALLTWAVLDVYFYSILTESLRQYGERWQESNGAMRYFRYVLGCPHCLSHWIAAVILAVLVGLNYVDAVPVTLHPVLAILFLPVVARMALVFRDYSLPPLTNHYVTETEPDIGTSSNSNSD